jgi:hypothetical protein
MPKHVVKKKIFSFLIIGACISGIIVPSTRRPSLARSLEIEQAIIRGKSKLLKRDRERLAKARAEGRTEVALVIASAPRANALVAGEILSLGGTVRYRADEVDYLRANVPVGSVDKLALLESTEAISLDGSVFFSTSSEADSMGTVIVSQNDVPQSKIDPPDKNTPAENPYLPTRDIGAPQFIAKHPNFDGRGVTIALLENGVPDLLCPELQEATTLDGKPVRKLIDVLDAYDPDDNNHKIKMDEVVSSNGRFPYQGIEYTAPTDGRYRFGFFDATWDARIIDKGAIFDGRSSGSSGRFGVLWDKGTNTVWVDTNQNRNFVDDKALTDYNVRYDFGVFGKDNPNTPIRETEAFIIMADVRNEFIRLYPTLNAHTTAVASAAAGRGFFGGKMNGVAPGAQVISVVNSLTNHGVIEGMILAMRHPKVDVVSAQIASWERIKDGSSPVSIVWDRLVDLYKKPIVIGASNYGPGITTISGVTSGSKVLSVGAYIHRDTLRVNSNVVADQSDNIVGLSSRGPRMDGGFKPDVVAPDGGVYAGWPAPVQGNGLTGTYKLPPGYSIGFGTSDSTPMASAAAALLISAARQTGIPNDADRLRWAMKSSARYLPGYAACDQGDGLIQVEAAWEALQKVPMPVAITSRAPVNHILSQYLKDHDRGPGIYEREGWIAEESAERRISFTRTSGQAGPARYVARWVGNDGTFKSAETISLPLNTYLRFPVIVSPKSPGVHSAILRLLDPTDSHVVYEVMNTVVVADQFVESKGFTLSEEGQLEHRPGSQSYFFKVPENTAAFKFDLNVVRGNLRAKILNPAGVVYGVQSQPYSPSPPYQRVSGKQSRTIAKPEPGVWEVSIEDDDYIWDRKEVLDREGAMSQEKGKFTFRASVFGVESQPAMLEIEAPQKGGDGLLEVSFTNRLASFAGSINETALGSAFVDSPTLTELGTPKIYEISVPAGAESIRAQISGGTDKDADLDLYLYECTGKGCGTGESAVSSKCEVEGCELKAFSISSGSGEAVEVVNPNPGKWKVVIDPVSVPTGETQCVYVDTFTHRAFGEIAEDRAVKRASGETWKQRVEVRAAAVPEGPRYLAAVIEVVSDKAETVGYTFPTGSNPKSPVERRVGLGSVVVKMGSERFKAGSR